MRNFHVPLADPIYESLQLEARRCNVPATTVARKAIQAWLDARKRAKRQRAIAAYAHEAAGTMADLDPDLERATLEFLREEEWT
jgi:hypothetical protein